MIRPFIENNDFQACINLMLNVFNNEPWNDNWTYEGAEKYLLDYINTPGFKGFIAEEDNKTKGFLFGFRKRWWQGDEFYINEMCVEISEQRNGIGTKLIKYLEDKLAAEGIENITLLTDRGIPAEHFYKKNGFNEIERIIFLHKNIK